MCPPHCRHPHLCDPQSARSWVTGAPMCRLCQRGPWLDKSSQQHEACGARCWCGRATKVTFLVLSLRLLDSVQGSSPAMWATCFVELSGQRLPGAQARRPARPLSQHHAGRRSITQSVPFQRWRLGRDGNAQVWGKGVTGTCGLFGGRTLHAARGPVLGLRWPLPLVTWAQCLP